MWPVYPSCHNPLPLRQNLRGCDPIFSPSSSTCTNNNNTVLHRHPLCLISYRAHVGLLQANVCQLLNTMATHLLMKSLRWLSLSGLLSPCSYIVVTIVAITAATAAAAVAVAAVAAIPHKISRVAVNNSLNSLRGTGYTFLPPPLPFTPDLVTPDCAVIACRPCCRR